MTSLANLPNFLMYFGASIVLLAAFLGAYTLILPLHEWTLIREGNAAVALSLSGATLGFALPLASAVVSAPRLRGATWRRRSSSQPVPSCSDC
jgi:putative membrane protein